MVSHRILGSFLLTIFVIGKRSAESRDFSNFLKDVVNAHAFSPEQKQQIQNLKDSKHRNVRLQQDCTPSSRFGSQRSGIYAIKPKDSSPLLVYCDMENENGGWILVQRFVKGSTLSVQKTWSEYETTFGDVNSNYWLGVTYLHQITEQQRYEVKFIFEHGKDSDEVKFDGFNVDGSANNFALRLGAPVNNITSYHKKLLHIDNMMFSTRDKDNDGNPTVNCAEVYGGGWWFNNCPSVTSNNQPTVLGSICGDCDSVSILIKGTAQNCIAHKRIPK
ncbi:fibrinogen-like protein 1-like protein [Mobula hypostoma]|uniref:fibrinogen-like protein 1-like protein n=1 Tax=Mobula hypostoma TaxID=723540 RepID=UPI002FC372F1